MAAFPPLSGADKRQFESLAAEEERLGDVFACIFEGNLLSLVGFVAADPSLVAAHAGAMNGCTLLHVALGEGENDCAEHLLREGAATTAVDEDGKTPLHLACAATSLAVLQALIRGAKESPGGVDVRDRGGQTPLFAAVDAQALRAVEALLAAGADADARSLNGLTPRDVASAGGFDDDREEDGEDEDQDKQDDAARISLRNHLVCKALGLAGDEARDDAGANDPRRWIVPDMLDHGFTLAPASSASAEEEWAVGRSVAVRLRACVEDDAAERDDDDDDDDDGADEPTMLEEDVVLTLLASQDSGDAERWLAYFATTPQLSSHAPTLFLLEGRECCVRRAKSLSRGKSTPYLPTAASLALQDTQPASELAPDLASLTLSE